MFYCTTRNHIYNIYKLLTASETFCKVLDVASNSLPHDRFFLGDACNPGSIVVDESPTTVGDEVVDGALEMPADCVRRSVVQLHQTLTQRVRCVTHSVVPRQRVWPTINDTSTHVGDCALRLHQRWSLHALCVPPLATEPSRRLLICLEQSAGVSTGIAVTASFSQQTEDRAFCPVVQLL